MAAKAEVQAATQEAAPAAKAERWATAVVAVERLVARAEAKVRMVAGAEAEAAAARPVACLEAVSLVAVTAERHRSNSHHSR